MDGWNNEGKDETKHRKQKQKQKKRNDFKETPNKNQRKLIRIIHRI